MLLSLVPGRRCLFGLLLLEKTGFFDLDDLGDPEALGPVVLLVVDGVLQEVAALEGEGTLPELFQRGGEYYHGQFDLILFVLYGSIDFLEVETAGVALLCLVVVPLVFAEVGAQLFEGVLRVGGVFCVPAGEGVAGLVVVHGRVGLGAQQLHPKGPHLLIQYQNNYSLNLIKTCKPLMIINPSPFPTSPSQPLPYKFPPFITGVVNSIINKNIDKRMQKLVRYRKAFYEKENDLQCCNKRRDRVLPNHSKSMNLDKHYQTLPLRVERKPKQKSNTSAYCELYAEELLRRPEYESKPRDFLSRHLIDGTLRARMLDWMVEVTTSYKFTHKTYFDGVSLMDRYFEAEATALPPTKLHLIGVQCMLIASKMQEVYPLKIRTVYEKIAHKKLPLEDLIETEGRIMKTLDYKLNTWSFFDLITLKLALFANLSEEDRKSLKELDFNSKPPSEEQQSAQLKHLEQLCSFLSKFAVYDYEFYIDCPMQLLAQSILKAAFQITSILPPPELFSSSPIQIELCKQRILKLVKQYPSRFGGLGNLQRFAGKEVVAQVEKFLE